MAASLSETPESSRFLGEKELELIEDLRPRPEPDPDGALDLGTGAHAPGLWLLLFGRLITDPVWYFYQFWFAKYLSTDRGLSTGGAHDHLGRLRRRRSRQPARRLAFRPAGQARHQPGDAAGCGSCSAAPS